MSKFTQLWGVLLISVLFASSCKKAILEEPQFNEQALRAAQTKSFKLNTRNWYRVNPANKAAVPGMDGQMGFANMPGAGSGTASTMGNVATWFNQLAFSPTGDYPQAGVMAAPLADIANYSSTVSRGNPLPAIQPDDLRPFATLMNWLNIPATVNNKVVWSVVYNGSGDAVFLSCGGPCMAVQQSSTKITYSGQGTFVGGRGKYANATGTYQISGFFNPQDANDAGYTIDGDITF